MQTLRSTKSHPTAGEVYMKVKERIPHVSLGTIYRNLDQLSGEEKILKLTVGGVSHFDATVEMHSHFFCQHCNRILDVHGDIKVTPEISKVEELVGCKIVGTDVTFYGLCKECKSVMI